MSKEQVFKKCGFRLACATTHHHFQRYPAQGRKWLPLPGIESKRHKRGSGLYHFKAKLASYFQGKVGGAQLRYCHASRRQHQLPGLDGPFRPRQEEDLGIATNFVYPARHAPADTPCLTLLAQHLDDFFTGAIAEQLATMLLVPANTMTLDQNDEVTRRIACQRRTTEIGVLRNELCRRRTYIGKVAAPASRDTDFFGEPLGMIDQHDAKASLARD